MLDVALHVYAMQRSAKKAHVEHVLRSSKIVKRCKPNQVYLLYSHMSPPCLVVAISKMLSERLTQLASLRVEPLTVGESREDP